MEWPLLKYLLSRHRANVSGHNLRRLLGKLPNQKYFKKRTPLDTNAAVNSHEGLIYNYFFIYQAFFVSTQQFGYVCCSYIYLYSICNIVLNLFLVTFDVPKSAA